MDFLNEQQVERQVQQEIDADIMAMAGDDDYGDHDDDAAGYSAWTSNE